MNKPKAKNLTLASLRRIFCAVVLLATVCGQLEARTLLKNICRLKGQEENTIQGLGLVVGLKGSGDGGNFLPTLRSLEKTMKVLGEPLGRKSLEELKDAKNVAIVMVTATIPAAGARQGDKIDCIVSSIGGAKSLAGGRLILTPLIGPDRNNPKIYAFAEGAITIEGGVTPTNGRIFEGCRLEEEFFNSFVKEGKITLVLDKNHADFQMAQEVADLLNNQLSFQSSAGALAKAINQENVEVSIPAQYVEDPVMFVSQVLSQPIIVDTATMPRVVINERAGSIVISGEVEIGAVVVSHKNIVIEAGAAPSKSFVALNANPAEQESPKLKTLVEALNALHVATPDVIDIIKGLDKNGKLHAELIIE